MKDFDNIIKRITMNLFKKLLLLYCAIFQIYLFATPTVFGKKSVSPLEASKVATGITVGTVAARKAAIEGQQAKLLQGNNSNQKTNQASAGYQGTMSSGTFINRSSTNNPLTNSATFKENTVQQVLPKVVSSSQKLEDWNTILKKEDARILAEKKLNEPIYERPVLKVTQESLYAVPPSQRVVPQNLSLITLEKPVPVKFTVRNFSANESIRPIIPPKPAHLSFSTNTLKDSTLPPPRSTAEKSARLTFSPSLKRKNTPPPIPPKPNFLK